ncbi:MAG: cupin domain-containing protein [Alphaproteobacteria bacterium]|nr:MAG: cupin domain-containing protein [Alphaproteobacteria bacterium]
MTRILTILLAASLLAGGTDAGDENGFVRLRPQDLHWQESIRPGLSFALIEGDPRKAGFYIIRARFAPGHFTRPHIHPHDRFVTVIEGIWWTGTGTRFDPDRTIPLGPGSYMKHPAGAPHFDGAKNEPVIVEIKGEGPAPIIFVDEDGRPIESPPQ